MERNIFECKRCGHKWMSRKEHPTVCAKCHSAYWDTPKSIKGEHYTGTITDISFNGQRDKVLQEGDNNGE